MRVALAALCLLAPRVQQSSGFSLAPQLLAQRGCGRGQGTQRDACRSSPWSTSSSSSYARVGRKRPAMSLASSSSSPVAAAVDNFPEEWSKATRYWNWSGPMGDFTIRYKVLGEGSPGPAMLFVHGFGGNADHFRKNIAELQHDGPCYAIDLLGYGFSSKPDPGPWEEKNGVYNFSTWGQQLLDFQEQVIKQPVFLVCNSVGAIAGMQATIDAAKSGSAALERFKGVVILNVSLRMLHTEKQAPLMRPFVKALQYVLRETPLGAAFFGSVAKAETVKSILQQCYGDPEAVTDELVQMILEPGLTPGAVKVFLDFISFSGGPLPEDLLAQQKVPVVIGWGEVDPWEPLALAREAFGSQEAVEDFIVLPGAGHCPQDEAPQLVNPLVRSFVSKHTQQAAPVKA